MNILFVIGSYCNFGGTERITAVIANAFSENGHGVGIASFRGKNSREMFCLLPAVRDYELGKHPSESLRRILVEGDVDVIVNQWCLPFEVTRIINKARRGLNVKLVSALHGVPDRSKRVIVAEDLLLGC